MTGRHPLLLVEDNPSIARVYLEYLRRGPYDTLHCETGTAALAALAETSYAAVLLDIELPDMSGMEILKWITQRRLNTAVVVITAHGSINIAVEAMREGASDFLVKPFAPERLFVTLDNALERMNLRRIVDTFDTPGDSDQFCGFVGNSLAMRGVYRIVDIAAQSKAPVFITGESGTGKELAAEAVHLRSPRKDKPFIALNCAAFPKDLIESEVFGHVKGAFTGAVADREGAGSRADGGTLFFDEICEMDVGLQAKLLRFIQTGTFQKVGGTQTQKVDVRFISATNRDPLKEVEAGRFREDLYYRLYVMPLLLPPIREREDDVLLIARRFLAEYSREEGRAFQRFSPETESILVHYAWPGNVRQLQNVVRQIVLLNDGETVVPFMLPAPLSQVRPAPAPAPAAPSLHPMPAISAANGQAPAEATAQASFSLSELERDLIELALEQCGGNVLQAAARLEISPSTLYRKREQFPPLEKPSGRVRELKPLALAESETIKAAIAAAGGNISRAAAALGVNPSTLYRKMQSKTLV
ncbi:MAG: two-component response regulator, Fis-type [Rhodospirillales bacterium]|nr:two-component response regulator, Fis-type [Rhodospirillales bacterium]